MLLRKSISNTVLLITAVIYMAKRRSLSHPFSAIEAKTQQAEWLIKRNQTLISLISEDGYKTTLFFTEGHVLLYLVQQRGQKGPVNFFLKVLIRSFRGHPEHHSTSPPKAPWPHDKTVGGEFQRSNLEDIETLDYDRTMLSATR